MVTVPLALPVAFGGKVFQVMVTEAVFTGLPFIFTPVSTVPVVVPPCVPLGCVKVVGVTVKLPVPITKVLVTVWQLVGFCFSHTL